MSTVLCVWRKCGCACCGSCSSRCSCCCCCPYARASRPRSCCIRARVHCRRLRTAPACAACAACTAASAASDGVWHQSRRFLRACSSVAHAADAVTWLS
eukprot:31636_2